MVLTYYYYAWESLKASHVQVTSGAMDGLLIEKPRWPLPVHFDCLPPSTPSQPHRANIILVVQCVSSITISLAPHIKSVAQYCFAFADGTWRIKTVLCTTKCNFPITHNQRRCLQHCESHLCVAQSIHPVNWHNIPGDLHQHSQRRLQAPNPLNYGKDTGLRWKFNFNSDSRDYRRQWLLTAAAAGLCEDHYRLVSLG